MVKERTIQKKQAIVDSLADIFSANGVFLFDYKGLTVKEFEKLRNQVKENGGNIKVIKNRLALKYFEQHNQKDVNRSVFKNTIAVVYSNEKYVEVAKILNDFAAENKKIQIKAGLIQSKLISDSEVIQVAKLPSRDQLLANFAGAFAAPLKKFGMTLAAPLINFGLLLKAYKEKKDKGG